MTEFKKFSNILFGAYKRHTRQQEVLAKKTEIFNTIFEIHNFAPERILFLGFSAMALACKLTTIYVADISDDAVDYIKSQGKEVVIVELEDKKYTKFFDCVVAMDENFTFAANEGQQRTRVELCAALTTGLIITTLRDYKNQEYKDREFSQPAAIRNGAGVTAYLEYHNIDFRDRAAWRTTVFEMGEELQKHGPYARRAMFFKQLAKYTKDAGAADFMVHKNLMYKSLIKKNYEHVISIKFE
jgi:hypothetical protein